MIPTSTRARVLAGAAAVLVAATATTWATGTGPFGTAEPSHCWGTWQDDEDGDALRLTEGSDGSPSAGRPQGSCTATISTSGGPVVVTVAYGPAPESPSARAAWLFGHLGPGTVPLPDGLPGAAGADSGLLVLPEKCDTSDGRPTAVTLRTDSTSTTDLGGIRQVAKILAVAADHGMEKAGCAPAEPLRTTSPVFVLPEDNKDYSTKDVCRIPGLDFPDSRGTRLEYQVGPVTRDLQSCAVRDASTRSETLDLLMVAHPRLSALAGDVAGETRRPGWRGSGTYTHEYAAVRADCAGRSTTFLTLDPDATLSRFATFTNAAARRLGCAAVAPAGDTA